MILKYLDDFIILNKPSRLHTLSQKDSIQSVEAWLYKTQASQRDLPEAGLLHRLDYLTSGCLVAAKNRRTYDQFRNDFQKNLSKTYWAWVKGSLAARGRFCLYFRSRYKRSQKVRVFKKGDLQERGEAHWTERKRIEDQCLIEIRLLGPGRRHQIRAGFSFLGAPIIGDPLYGSGEASFFGLHSRSVDLGQGSIEAPPPPSWPKV